MGRLVEVATTVGLIIAALTHAAWGQVRPAPPPADRVSVPRGEGWAVDSRTGCWLWNPDLRPEQTVTWSGGCDPNGQATGPGVVEWRLGDQLERGEGEYRDGKLDGRGVMTFAGGARYEGEWRHGRPNGRGVYRRADGNRFAGEWLDGCFRDDERRVAAGRPLSECR